MSEFDDLLRIVDGRAELGAGWVIGEAVNGGALMALANHASRQASGWKDADRDAAGENDADRDAAGENAAAPAPMDPIAFTTTFLQAAHPGHAEVQAQVLRAGRSFATVEVSIRQGENLCLRQLVTLGDASRQSGPVHRQEPAPPMPPADECVLAGLVGLGAEIPLGDRLDLRLDPATAGWATQQRSEPGEMRAWIGFADGREPDLAALAFFLDAMPPVTFTLGAMGWAPTLSFAGHLRALPAPGLLQMRIATRNVIGELFEEDATIWDSRGNMVAQSRQLGGVRMPSTPS